MGQVMTTGTRPQSWGPREREGGLGISARFPERGWGEWSAQHSTGDGVGTEEGISCGSFKA